MVHKIMPERSKKVIIFDWDDTICPSSFVDQCKIESSKDLPLYLKNIFHEVGKSAEKCLNAASLHGEVIIITNADDGWVKFSAERFIPKLLPCLERYRIVSARTRYERFYPNQPLCWKAAAFAHEVNEIYSASSNGNNNCDTDKKQTVWNPVEDDDDVASLVSTEEWEANTSISSLSDEFGSIISPTKKNRRSIHNHQLKEKIYHQREVISFGDSMEERTAVRIVAHQLKARPKSVMFMNSPSPVQIIGQLNMLTDNMDFVCRQNGVLDLEISPREAIKAAEDFLVSRSDLLPNLPGNINMQTTCKEMDAIAR